VAEVLAPAAAASPSSLVKSLKSQVRNHHSNILSAIQLRRSAPELQQERIL
jgi:hypothetical protein